jgi:hypothetical protein
MLEQEDSFWKYLDSLRHKDASGEWNFAIYDWI